MEPGQGLATVALLGAVIARDDENFSIADQAVAGQRAQARLGAFIERRATGQVEAQLRRGGHLVDVLAAGTGAAHETDADIAVRDEQWAAHGARCSPISRTSCCATGMVMPASWNKRQMWRLTSERMLLTRFCGSAIQK